MAVLQFILYREQGDFVLQGYLYKRFGPAPQHEIADKQTYSCFLSSLLFQTFHSTLFLFLASISYSTFVFFSVKYIVGFIHLLQFQKVILKLSIINGELFDGRQMFRGVKIAPN